MVGTDSALALPAQAYAVHQVPPAGAPDFSQPFTTWPPGSVRDDHSYSERRICGAGLRWHLGAVFPVLVSSGQAYRNLRTTNILRPRRCLKARVVVPRFALPLACIEPAGGGRAHRLAMHQQAAGEPGVVCEVTGILSLNGLFSRL